MLYLGWATLLFTMQRRMMYPGWNASLPSITTNGVPDGAEFLRLPFSDGSAEAWFLAPPGQGRAPAVVFAHGNAELIENGVRDALSLTGMGLSVLLVEYPGYGQSDGSPSRQSIGEVFLAAYDWLVARPDIDDERIVGMGRSLGTGAITDLARSRPLRALVLQSAFTSVASFAKQYLLPGFLARDRFDNLDVLRDFPRPVLLVHGSQDEVIPYSHGERLSGVSTTVELLTLECGHNDCPPDWRVWEEALGDFLLRAGVLPADR
jgi:fermentation-respiration switch protein FrsA (DUF1100 family)